MLGDALCDDYVSVYDGTLTTETSGDDWEAVIVTQARGEMDEDDDSGYDKPEALLVITVRDAQLQIKLLLGSL